MVTATGQPVLELKGIGKEFGAIRALHEVDLHVLPGEVVGLMGDNGAGKSTLVKIIAGNFPPTNGEIRFDGLMEVDRLAGDADLAVGRREIAGDNLDQGRLPGAVVAHKPEDFAGLERHVDFVQRMNGAEMLGDRLEFKNRQADFLRVRPHSIIPRPSGATAFILLFLTCQHRTDWTRAQGQKRPFSYAPL